MQINLTPIGYVSNNIQNKKDKSWGNDISKISLEKQCIEGLTGVSDFSHEIISYYLENDKVVLLGNPDKLKHKKTGIKFLNII